jgi:hypothetical protein
LLATRYLKAQKNLHHNTLYNPRALCSLKTSLGFLDADVLLYPMVLLILPSLVRLRIYLTPISKTIV